MTLAKSSADPYFKKEQKKNKHDIYFVQIYFATLFKKLFTYAQNLKQEDLKNLESLLRQFTLPYKYHRAKDYHITKVQSNHRVHEQCLFIGINKYPFFEKKPLPFWNKLKYK